ncbi:MAG: HAMP domain-containing protein [Treponema sp.]|jgi:adenylate cyclase|nr:HAMP domain-containing protein [Treponema sp.]
MPKKTGNAGEKGGALAVKQKGNKNAGTAGRIRYPIGLKLVVIISGLVLFSLSLITALVSVMVSNDVRITAEDNNLNVNSRSAAEAESTLNRIRSNALVLLDTLAAAGGSPALSRQAAAFFFERNQDVAAIAIAAPGVAGDGVSPSVLLVNDRFFLANETDAALVDGFLAASAGEAGRAALGEPVILNGTPVFGIPLLCLLYPWQEGGYSETAAVFFSPEALSETFETGANSSFMINGEGDLLVHPEHGLVRAGANFADRDFIRSMRENAAQGQSRQSLYTGEDGRRYFGAFSDLSLAGAAVITNIEYDLVFEGIAATTRRNIYLTIAVILAAVIFTRLFSNTISRPLKALTGAAEQIEGGQFELTLEPKTRDEVGALTVSFDRMSKALGVFGRFTNREIAVRAMRGEIKPGGLPREATVFFSDIRSFTEKSEIFTREFGDEASDRIVRWLNEYFTRMVDCVEKTGGVVDKFIGDAVMAHWGTAYTSGSAAEDAFNSVRAALLMRSALVEMNRGRKAGDPGNPPIRIGCGINTGIVTAGQIGSERRMEYTVIGDPVNLASRTEALNKPLGTDILITENTWELTGDRIRAEEMPPVRVKGKEKPVRLFAVLGLKNGEGRGEGEPETLAELRELLGIEPPEPGTADTETEEKKYKIGGGV